MKNLSLLLIILVFTNFASADDYSLNELCSKDDAKKKDFVENLRDKIVRKTIKLKPDTKASKSFEKSDMYNWLSMTYPSYLPSFLYDAGFVECANLHVNFLEEKNALKAASKKDLWIACVNASYKDELPPKVAAVVNCHNVATIAPVAPATPTSKK